MMPELWNEPQRQNIIKDWHHEKILVGYLRPLCIFQHATLRHSDGQSGHALITFSPPLLQKARSISGRLDPVWPPKPDFAMVRQQCWQLVNLLSHFKEQGCVKPQAEWHQERGGRRLESHSIVVLMEWCRHSSEERGRTTRMGERALKSQLASEGKHNSSSKRNYP